METIAALLAHVGHIDVTGPIFLIAINRPNRRRRRRFRPFD